MVTMMTDEQRAAILAEAHAHLERASDYTPGIIQNAEPEPPPEFLHDAKTHDWRDHRPPPIARAEMRRTLDIAPEPRLTRRQVRALIAEAIAEALAAERATQQEIFVRVVASVRDDAAHEIADATRSLRLELTELATVVAELRSALAEARIASATGERPLTQSAKH
jgi:hypothetical protein